MQNPNIVFIFADDMGYGDLSCQNPESLIQTPNLDKLASQGVRFEDAHASSAVCTPSRYSLLTGRYCWRGALKSGVLWGYSGALIEPDRLTLQKHLQNNGYHTACVGKWHLGLTWQTKSKNGKTAAASLAAADRIAGPKPDNVDFSKPILNGPLTTGFDYFFGISASLDMDPYCYIENDRVTAVPDRVLDASPYNAYWREGPIAPDFEHVDVLPTLTSRAVNYIKSRAESDNPFFLYFPLNGPHTPIVPAAEFRGRSKAGDYGDFVMQCDDVVGQIMAALETAGVADNTLLIFSSDNGAERIAYERALETGHYSMGPLRGLKRDVWEGGHRIPFVARWPGVTKPGTINSQTICLVDLMATASEILKNEIPENAAEDSLSFLSMLKGSSIGQGTREAIIHHSMSGKFAIRKDNWILIDDPTGDDNVHNGEPQWLKEKRGYTAHDYPAELFDLENDLAERHNLYAEQPDIVNALRELLEKYKREGRSVYRK